jgi:hypothetical protein
MRAPPRVLLRKSVRVATAVCVRMVRVCVCTLYTYRVAHAYIRGIREGALLGKG